MEEVPAKARLHLTYGRETARGNEIAQNIAKNRSVDYGERAGGGRAVSGVTASR